MPRRAHRHSVGAVIRRTLELARAETHPAESELRATAQSLAARRTSGEGSGGLLPEILVTCARAVGLVTGQFPAEDVIAAAAHSAVGVVPVVPDCNARNAALAMTAYWHATAGEGVHVMVAAEQEARPVKEFLAKVLDHLGSSVGLLGSSVSLVDPASAAAEARSAYAADVTVGACAAFAADFLRDNLYYTVFSDTVQRELSRLIVTDVDETLVSRAREHNLLTAPVSGKTRVAVELAADLRSGIDYQTDPRQRAVHIAASAMGHIKASVGWKDLPTEQTVSRVMAVEQELVRREELAGPEERKVFADVSVRGYVREYPIVTGFACKWNTEAVKLARLYGLDAVSHGLPLIRRLQAMRRHRDADEEEMLVEELFDVQRRVIYDLRRQVRDQQDPEEIARVFVVDTARHWSTLGTAALQGHLRYVLGRNAVVHSGGGPEQLQTAVIEALTVALGEVHRRAAPSDVSDLIRRAMLIAIDFTWSDHIARARFLQRQAPALYIESRRMMQRKRDLDHLFAGCLHAIKRDSLKYIVSAQPPTAGPA